MITRRPRRLRGFDYVGFQRYFLTACTSTRRPHFTSPAVVEHTRGIFCECATSSDFAIAVYCFMPDHLHALISATTERADFREFVRRFKQISAFRHQARFAGKLWQPGFHERVLRDDESTGAVARYILENPIRAGLSRTLGEYPFAGSDIYDVGALSDLWRELDELFWRT